MDTLRRDIRSHVSHRNGDYTARAKPRIEEHGLISGFTRRKGRQSVRDRPLAAFKQRARVSRWCNALAVQSRTFTAAGKPRALGGAQVASHDRNLTMILKQTIMVLASLLLARSGCDNPPTYPYYGLATVEGIVGYYPPTLAIGGEADPSGFILIEYHWVVNISSSGSARLYIQGAVDSSYMNTRVRLSGELTTITVGGFETQKRTFPLMHVHTLQIIP